MGLFDDLVPNQEVAGSAGLFDDLVPTVSKVDPVHPEVPVKSIDQVFAEGIARNPNAPRPLITDLGEEQGPIDPRPASLADLVAPVVDESSLAQDFEAGKLLLSQVIPGIKTGKGIRELNVGLSDTLPVDKNLQELDAVNEEIEIITETLGTRLPSDQKLALSQRLQELGQTRGQLELLVGDGAGQAIGREGVAEAEGGLATILEQIPNILANSAQAAEIPINPSAAKVGEAETFGEGISAFLEDPAGVARTFAVRSGPAAVPTVVSSIVGQVLGGPTGAALLGGSVGANTELGISVSQGVEEELRASGVDLKSAEAIEEFFVNNPDKTSEIVNKALTRAGVIGTADALTGGLSGALAKSLSNASKAKRVSGIGVGGTLEAAGEGAGEAAAMQITEGKIAPGEVIAEVIGGGAPGAVTTGGQIITESLRKENAGTEGVDPSEQLAEPEAVQIQSSTPEIQPQEQKEPDAPEEIEQEVPPEVVDEVDTPEDIAESDPVEARAQEPQKRPLTHRIKALGVDPKGKAAEELRSAGITSRTHPGLFNKNGVKDVDNLPADEWADLSHQIGIADDGIYLDRQGVINALVQEAAGDPVQNINQASLQAAIDAEEAHQRFLQQDDPIGEAPLLLSSDNDVEPRFFIPHPDKDISTPVQRADMIVGDLDATLQATGLSSVITPEERSEMINDLDLNGGYPEDLIWRAVHRSVENAENKSFTVKSSGSQAPTQSRPESAGQSEFVSVAEIGSTTQLNNAGRSRESTAKTQKRVKGKDPFKEHGWEDVEIEVETEDGSTDTLAAGEVFKVIKSRKAKAKKLLRCLNG